MTGLAKAAAERARKLAARAARLAVSAGGGADCARLNAPKGSNAGQSSPATVRGRLARAARNSGSTEQADTTAATISPQIT